MNNDQVDRGLGSYSVGKLIKILGNRDLIRYEVGSPRLGGFVLARRFF